MSAAKAPATRLATATPVIGHATVIDLLSRALESGRLVHGYLFVGPPHVGKGTVARALAEALLGTKQLATHPDFFPVERGTDEKTDAVLSGITIDQIRGLLGNLALGAMMRGWKVALIEDAQLMNDAAANALLKSLEEPHPKTVLILLADDAENVMPTIRSRCQIVRFPRVAVGEVRDGLVARGCTHDDADLYARLSAGRPGLALRFAEHPEDLAGMRAMREAILGLHGQSVAERWKTLAEFLPAKAPFIELGIAADRFLDLAAELLRDVMLLQQDADATLTHADVRAQTARWAAHAGADRIEAALHALTEAKERISRNVNPRAVLEHFTLAL